MYCVSVVYVAPCGGLYASGCETTRPKKRGEGEKKTRGRIVCNTHQVLVRSLGDVVEAEGGPGRDMRACVCGEGGMNREGVSRYAALPGALQLTCTYPGNLFLMLPEPLMRNSALQ